jgi:hypothetical protein
MRSPTMRALARPQLVVLAAALLAFGAFAIYRTATSAQAHETYVDMSMTCDNGSQIKVSYTVNHDPEAGAIAGQLFTIKAQSSVTVDPAMPDVPLSTVAVTIAEPADVGPAGDVKVVGGNLTKASQTTASGNIVVNLTAGAGVSPKTLQVPELDIPVNLPAATAGKILNFPGPSQIALGMTGQPTVGCTAAATNSPLITVKPSGGTATTTGGGGPTTVMEHDHGGPTSTGVKPTTTTLPKPTTTAADHDHGGPATTLPKPTTTAADHDHGGPATTVAKPTTTVRKPTTTAADHDHGGGPTTTRLRPPSTHGGPPTTHVGPPPMHHRPPVIGRPGLERLLHLLIDLVCHLFRIC